MVGIRDDLEVQVKYHPKFDVNGGLATIATEFKRYKKFGLNINMFGRDVLCNKPQTCADEKVCHIHILKKDSPNYYNKNAYYRTSDAILLYTCSTAKDGSLLYFLLEIIDPNGHDGLNEESRMLSAANRSIDFRIAFECAVYDDIDRRNVDGELEIQKPDVYVKGEAANFMSRQLKRAKVRIIKRWGSRK